MTLSLRQATLDDAPAVRTLSRAAYAKWVPVIGREPRPMTVDYEQAVVEHRIDLHEPGGVLAALIETELRPDDLLIVNLAVAPRHQGRGLGGQLLRHAERLAGTAGRPLVRLYTNKRMAANIAYYAGHGFVPEREEPFVGGVAVHMVKPLAVVPA